MPSMSPLPPQTPSPAAPSLLDDEAEISSVEQASALPGPIAKAKKKRIYPSDGKAPYGYIEGAGRGNGAAGAFSVAVSGPMHLPFGSDMARTREQKPAFVDQTLATRYYREKAKDILTRCEDLAHRTSCWVYIAVQHPAANSTFLHYASLKLRMEAPQELNQLHKDVGRMMSTLKRADRLQAIDATRYQQQADERVQMAEEQAREADARAQRAESETDRLRNELDARNRLLAKALEKK
ncbi:hypothetical protein EST38_g12077 [Candolleomyces aberdarensis]|uniref:Uncharacterized protein n=1 Tax=Candolleomyces aberdarensis TaxID=2316362 RepID=A0A4V1Q242_9AGAR|nr:hypothetical protein EST38_g12077 [Candolleomyces aberdarensis]